MKREKKVKEAAEFLVHHSLPPSLSLSLSLSPHSHTHSLAHFHFFHFFFAFLVPLTLPNFPHLPPRSSPTSRSLPKGTHTVAIFYHPNLHHHNLSPSPLSPTITPTQSATLDCNSWPQSAMAYVFGSPVVSSAAVQQLASATTNGGGQLNLLQQHQHQQQQQQQQQHSNNKQQNSLGNNSSVASAAEQISRLQEQNGTLQRKLHTKSTEGARLQAKLERAEDEILLFRQTLDRIHRQLNAGEAPPGE